MCKHVCVSALGCVLHSEISRVTSLGYLTVLQCYSPKPALLLNTASMAARSNTSRASPRCWRGGEPRGGKGMCYARKKSLINNNQFRCSPLSPSALAASILSALLPNTVTSAPAALSKRAEARPMPKQSRSTSLKIMCKLIASAVRNRRNTYLKSHPALGHVY